MKLFYITKTLLKLHLLVASPLSVQSEHKYDSARKNRGSRTAPVLLSCTALSAWHKSGPPSWSCSTGPSFTISLRANFPPSIKSQDLIILKLHGSLEKNNLLSAYLRNIWIISGITLVAEMWCFPFMASNTGTVSPQADKFFLVCPGDVLSSLLLKTYEPKIDYMSQKGCTEIPVCTETQQLSRDHWEHQHGFNKVKLAKVEQKKNIHIWKFACREPWNDSTLKQRMPFSWNYCKMALFRIWETLQKKIKRQHSAIIAHSTENYEEKK